MGETARTGGYENLMKCINTHLEVMISNLNQSCAFLPLFDVLNLFNILIYHYDINCKGDLKENIYFDEKTDLLD